MNAAATSLKVEWEMRTVLLYHLYPGLGYNQQTGDEVGGGVGSGLMNLNVSFAVCRVFVSSVTAPPLTPLSTQPSVAPVASRQPMLHVGH